MTPATVSSRALRAIALAIIFPSLDAASAAIAQPEEQTIEQDPEAAWKKHVESFPWIMGPGSRTIGAWGDVSIPEGMRFLEAQDAQRFIQELGNVPGDELGLVAPAAADWWVDFSFDKSGYVKDDEKETLDADAMLEALREGQQHANEARKRVGLEALTLVGFEQAPYFDDELKSLAWALRLRSENGGETVNFQARVLGRHGVMNATYVVSPEYYAANLPAAKDVVQAFRFSQGERYADFRKGDKIAEYGLTALVTGGVLAVAAKTGLLQKLWKPIVVAIVALGAFLKRLFRRKEPAPSSHEG